MNDLHSKVVGLADSLKACFLERDRMIEGLIVALLARQHVLLLGPPGTAKSALANALCNALTGGDFFQWLLTRFSTPEEVFGPVALSALKEDRFQRVTTGKLPEAHIAFLDETFKANSAILNALLTLINERRYHNNGGAMDCPLETLVGASNELPEGGPTGELAPLFDRFLVRYWVEPLKQDSAFVSLISDEAPDGSDNTVIGKPPTGALSIQELKQAQAEVAKVRIPLATAERLAQLRRELAQKGVQASDRRWKQACSALRANAWLSGDPEVTDDHFAILADCMWDDPEQRREVSMTVQGFCGQCVADALKCHDALIDLINKLPQNAEARKQEVSKVSREGKRAEEELDRLLTEATSVTNQKAIKKLQEQLKQALIPVRKEARAALGL